MRNYYTERHEIRLHKEQPEILVSNRRQRREQHKILRLCDDFACFGASHAGSYLVGNDPSGERTIKQKGAKTEFALTYKEI